MTSPATMAVSSAVLLAAAAFAMGALSGWAARRSGLPKAGARKPDEGGRPAGEGERERLARSEQELSGLIYSISHDVRAPLRSIDGFSQALLEDYSDRLDATAQGYLDRVRANTRRITDYIEHLPALSRLSRADMRAEELDLSAMATTLCETLAQGAPERPVNWTVQPKITAFGDREMIADCLRRLLDNAWKFTAGRDPAVVEFGSQTGADGSAEYFVRDNGAGFDMNYGGKLFGAFQRMHSPEEFAGAGIGLAAAQRVIHRHGGRIWVEAAPGAGATFFFTLGLEADVRGAARDSTAKPNTSRGGRPALQPSSTA